MLLKIEKNAILLVDDSMVARQLLSIQLAELGHTIFQAQDGKGALKLIEEEPSIGLVITDYEMPGMDGLALVINIRRKYVGQDIKVIAISGTLSEKVKQNFKNAGSTHFVSKPYNIEDLKASIHLFLK